MTQGDRPEILAAAAYSQPAEEPVAGEAARQVNADRERIAHDLNDSLLHRLFAVSLDLHSALPLVGEEVAEEKIRAAIAGLDEAVARLRDTVFDLHADGSCGAAARDLPGVRGRVVRMVEDLCDRLGAGPAVAFDGPLHAVRAGPGTAADEALAALGEVLANVPAAGLGAVRIRVRARTAAGGEGPACIVVRVEAVARAGARQGVPDLAAIAAGLRVNGDVCRLTARSGCIRLESRRALREPAGPAVTGPAATSSPNSPANSPANSPPNNPPNSPVNTEAA